jgi:hypothetical protein
MAIPAVIETNTISTTNTTMIMIVVLDINTSFEELICIPLMTIGYSLLKIGSSLVGTAGARSTCAACTTRGTSSNNFTTALGKENRYIPGSVIALTLLTGNWGVSIFHQTDNLEFGTAICTSIFVNGHIDPQLASIDLWVTILYLS